VETGGPLLRLAFAPTADERRIVLGALGAALLGGALTFGGTAPGAGRWVLMSVLAVCGLSLCAAALHGARTPRGLPHTAATVTIAVLAVLGSVQAVTATINGFTNPRIACRDDTALATMVGGSEIRAGLNPYVAYDEVQASNQLCGAPSGTPLRSGALAGSVFYPTDAQVQQAARGAFADQSSNAVERRLSYPAGSVLVGVGGQLGLVALTIAALIAAAVAVVRKAAAGARLVTSLAVLAQAGIWTVIDSGHPDGIAIALTVLAWVSPSPLTGALMLGGACAIKQTSWFVVLPFLATVWRRDGWRSALRSGVLITGVFVAVNAPFALAAPVAWTHAMLAPMVDGLFPQGDGLVALLTLHGIAPGAIAILSRLPYAVVIAGALLAVRLDHRLVGIGALAGSLALWFGQRSLPQYFIGIGFLAVALVVTATNHPPSPQSAPGLVARPRTWLTRRLRRAAVPVTA